MTNKLNKPKVFEASPKSIMVTFGAKGVECTNLLRSGIMHQGSILVADDGKWHEVEILNLGLESVDLSVFKDHIEYNKLKLSDLGIAEEVKDYELKHTDFMDLEAQFPAFSYIDIAKLYEYQKENGGRAGSYETKQILKMLVRDSVSIVDYINKQEQAKAERLLRIPTYSEVVDTTKAQTEIIVDTVPVPVPADSVSLQLFEKLTPERITELQGLKLQQEAVVRDNPVITITDKKTYAEAKKTAAILLSASTAIDGTKGVEATATKYLNTFKSMLKNALSPIAKITREPYDAQKKIIEGWDNWILLQAQNRVKELFAVPFIFDGANYSIGTLTVSQKDIDDSTDAEWSELIEKGKAIQIALESVKIAQNAEIDLLKKQNAELMARLEALLPKVEVEESTQVTTTATYAVTEQQIPPTQQSAPQKENKLLNALDLSHSELLEDSGYLKCREYYVQALSDVAKELQSIFDNPDKNVVKSEEIKKLIQIWK